MTQGTLRFGRNFRRSDPGTSKEAAEAFPESRGRQRDRVLAALRRHHQGLTDYELSIIVGIPRHIVARRRKDCCDQGYVIDSGTRRPTDNNVQAVVWRVVDRIDP